MIQWHPGYLGTVTEDGSSQLSDSHDKPHHDVDFVKMWDVNSAKVNSQRTDTNYVNRTPNVNITSIKRGKGERGKCRVYISEDSIYEII